MSIQFPAPMTCSQIADRAVTLMEEGGALAKLASALSEFEEATGRKLFVSEADQVEQPDRSSLTREEMLRKLQAGDVMATSGAEDQYCADSAPGVHDQDMPADLTGVEIENAAQVTGDGSGEALPPIDTGSAETVMQCRHLITHQTVSGDGTVTCEQCGDELPSVRSAPAAPRRVNDYTRPMDAQDAPVTAHAAKAPTRKAPAAPGVGRASYANGKPKAALKAKGDNRPWGKLTLPEREIVKHLERLPDTFAPKDDLRLVELLTGGNKIDVAAAFLEVEPADALARWKSFLTEEVIGTDGKPTLDGQARLINALQYRVEDGDA